MAGQAPGIRLDIVLAELGLPAGSYVLDTKIHSYDASLELTCLADVLLHPSKAEGFGMPLLEAQRIDFYAARALSPGEEITYDYGPRYWLYRPQPDPGSQIIDRSVPSSQAWSPPQRSNLCCDGHSHGPQRRTRPGEAR